MKKLYTISLLIAVFSIAFCSTGISQNIKPLSPLSYANSSPSNFQADTAAAAFTVFNGICYFAATTDYKHVRNLWRTDGTPAGTYMVSDEINYVNNIKVLNNKLYISTFPNIWLSDGTAAGSTNLTIFQGNFQGTDFVRLNSLSYFLSGVQIYSTDETVAGTHAIFDFGMPLLQNHYSFFTPLSNSFLLNIVFADHSLTYISDGSGGGTVPLDSSNNNRNITVVNDSIFFIKNGILYSNPGSPDAGSTKPVANLTGAVIETGNIGKTMQVINNALYFAATTPATGTELYMYNPATPAAGIILVKDVLPGTGSANIKLNTMQVVGNTLFFAATDINGSRQLWKTDGSGIGTALVKDFGTGTDSSLADFTNANGQLYFSFYNTTYGKELWKTDGTEAGTVLIKDINPGIYNANPKFMTAAAGQVFFTANDGIHGAELWKTDGTEAGTVLLKDINTTTALAPVNAQGFTQFNGRILYSGADDVFGRELWATDGTPAGTGVVKDINPGIASSSPQFLTAAGNGVYFLTDSASSGLHQLWKTDGTTAGTFLVRAFDSYTVQPFYISGAVNNLGFFWLSNNNNKELWRTDGTGAGTFKVTNLANSTNVNNIQFSAVGSTGYFVNGTDLWKTDGTEAGTVMVHHFLIMPSQLAVVNNTLFVYARPDIWMLNTSGFNKVTTMERVTFLQPIKNRLFFYLVQDINDEDGNYWYTDYYLKAVDTAGSVQDIYDFGSAGPEKFVLSGGKIYFAEETADARLGTVNDTLATVSYSTKNFRVFNLANGNGKLYFENIATPTTYNLGRSDGTYQGTIIISDTIQPFAFMYPLMVTGNHLVFPANIIYNSLWIFPNEFPDQLYAYEIDAAVLPVTQLSFTAKIINGNGLLNWGTATEQNSDYFSIQRSTDGLHFTSIGKVAAAGNSNYTQEYSYTDYKLSQYGVDRLYYRLQQFDKDGKFIYSKIVPLNINTSFTASISPIPVANQLNINITSAKRQTVLIQVVDMAGKTIASFSKTAEAGSTALSYNAAGWAKGIYQVHITQANGNKQTISVVR